MTEIVKCGIITYNEEYFEPSGICLIKNKIKTTTSSYLSGKFFISSSEQMSLGNIFSINFNLTNNIIDADTIVSYTKGTCGSSDKVISMTNYKNLPVFVSSLNPAVIASGYMHFIYDSIGYRFYDSLNAKSDTGSTYVVTDFKKSLLDCINYYYSSMETDPNESHTFVSLNGISTNEDSSEIFFLVKIIYNHTGEEDKKYFLLKSSIHHSPYGLYIYDKIKFVASINLVEICEALGLSYTASTLAIEDISINNGKILYLMSFNDDSITGGFILFSDIDNEKVSTYHFIPNTTHHSNLPYEFNVKPCGIEWIDKYRFIVINKDETQEDSATIIEYRVFRNFDLIY